MPLETPMLARDPRLRRAARNDPPMGLWDRDHNAVATIQRALSELGFQMDDSTRPDGTMDGIYGKETRVKVGQFQLANDLSADGIVGEKTMAALDDELQKLDDWRSQGQSFHYMVPGVKPVIEQPKSSVCWATTFTILKSWKDGTTYEIREAVERVGPEWAEKFDRNEGLYHEHAFLWAAGLETEPQSTLSIEGWTQMLRRHGLCYVALLMPRGGRQFVGHALVVEGIFGDGTPYGTRVSMIDPGQGKRGTQVFALVEALYAERGRTSGSPGDLQIGHF